MPRELSHECFYDLCDECNAPGCRCTCHNEQMWDLDLGWVDADDD